MLAILLACLLAPASADDVPEHRLSPADAGLTQGGFATSYDSITVTNGSGHDLVVNVLMNLVLDAPKPYHVDLRDDRPWVEQLWDFEATFDRTDRPFNVTWPALRDAFDIDFRVETRPTEVLVVRGGPRTADLLTADIPATPSAERRFSQTSRLNDTGEVELEQRHDSVSLAHALAGLFKLPAADELPDVGHVDFFLRAPDPDDATRRDDAAAREDAFRQIADVVLRDYDITLIREERPRTWLVVEPRGRGGGGSNE